MILPTDALPFFGRIEDKFGSMPFILFHSSENKSSPAISIMINTHQRLDSTFLASVNQPTIPAISRGA